MKLLSYPDLRPQKGYDKSRAQAWRDEKAGLIAKSIHIGNRKYWVDSEWDERIAARIAERDGKTTPEAA